MADGRISGTLPAAVTPLHDDGTRLDEDAFSPLLEFYRASGLDGLLVLGTTGEGILLEREERRRAAELGVPVVVVERLRERAPNLAAMEVSDAPFERAEPYLATGLQLGADCTIRCI